MNQNILKGGEFLFKQSNAENIFTPEDYNEEQLMFRSSIRKFLDKELEPIKEKFDTEEGAKIAPEILEKMGNLGFHALSVPEAYGGMNCDLKTELAFGEVASDSFALAQSIGVHTGLGIYPILFYGTTAQKEKYLSKIINAEIKCSYCLTEPSAGSDANAAKTRATISDDKTHFILNGQKMWITNAGFADVFFVFCKIENDENLSCLIVHKEWGVTLGEEEKKLGIKGSSTRQVFFEQIKVPIENLIGERNKGFKIAMNALNMGRLKIAVANSAISKRAFNKALNYAETRTQFGKSISNFGAIQWKVANMATKIYALESAWNRSAQQIDDYFESLLKIENNALDTKIKAVAEFAMECSINKVYGSEVEAYIVDEALQIYGGMGYSAENEISVLYRNIRGNRIYEGTNEINRLLITSTLLKKALNATLPIFEVAMNALHEIQNNKIEIPTSTDNLTIASHCIENAKKATILLTGLAAQTFQQKIQDEQEVLMNISDLIAEIYMVESAFLRTLKHKLSENTEVRQAIVAVLVYELVNKITLKSKEIIYACAENEIALQYENSLKALLYLPYINVIEKRRLIAKYFFNEKQYKV